MRPRDAIIVAGLAVGLSGVRATAAQDTRPTTAPAGLPANAFPIPLKPYAPGSAQFSFFVHRTAGKDIGYSEMSVIALGEGEQRENRYRQSTDILFAGERTTTHIDALLTPGFIPKKVSVLQIKVSRRGVRTETENRAVVEESEIVLTKIENGQSQTTRVPRPSVPFVYGLALVVGRINWEDFNDFTLPELDPMTGKAFTYRFTSEVGADQTRTIRASWGPPDRAYYFTLGPDNELTGWGQIPPAVTAKRSDMKTVKELKADLGLNGG